MNMYISTLYICLPQNACRILNSRMNIGNLSLKEVFAT